MKERAYIKNIKKNDSFHFYALFLTLLTHFSYNGGAR